MTDKELLEMAAKAAGITHHGSKGCSGIWIGHGNIFTGRLHSPVWNPLTDDGDALRLAVKLQLSMDLFDDAIAVGCTPNDNECEQVSEPVGSDQYTATRRAIVRAAASMATASEQRRNQRAAAEIGKATP